MKIKLIVGLLFLVTICNIAYSEESVLLSFETFEQMEWETISYGIVDDVPSNVESKIYQIEPDSMKYYDEYCLRVEGWVNSNAPGIIALPIQNSNTALELNRGMLTNVGEIQGAEIALRNLGDPVRITLILEDNMKNKGGIPFVMKFSGDSWIKINFENILRDLDRTSIESRYRYIKIAGIQVESLVISDYYENKMMHMESMSDYEKALISEKELDKNLESPILLDIYSISLRHGHHYYEPWEPIENAKKRMMESGYKMLLKD